MISTRTRSRLLTRSYHLHVEQLEQEFHNTLNAPHAFSIRAFHTLLGHMVCGQDPRHHGRWGWGAGTGWGKSTGICSFMKGAASLGLLGQPSQPWNHRQGISAIITAARIDSLYELEAQMVTDRLFPIPADRIMVLHSEGSNAFRPSDAGKDAPICLVAHNKLKYLSKLHTADQTAFLNYHGQPRDIVIVDEAFNESETVYLDHPILRYKLQSMLHHLTGRDATLYRPIIETLGPLCASLEAEHIRQAALPTLARAEGMILPPPMSKAEVDHLESLIRSLPLGREDRVMILKFLSMLPSPIRLIRGKQSGVVSVINTMPACLTNRIELNASFEVGMLSALDPTIKNADDHFPMLDELKAHYGLTGLADIIDYSDMQIVHLQRGGGKTMMSKHLDLSQAQTKGTVEVLNFFIEAIKATPLDQGILVLTYLADEQNYIQQLRRVFQKAGIDLNATILDAQGMLQPRIAFTTYGSHNSTNKFRYCSVGVLAGVQQRHKAELAGSMCGARGSIQTAIDFMEVDLVHQAVAAGDAQQGIGRLRCRMVVNGKALPVKVYIAHRDDPKGTFRARLKVAFPRATWADQGKANKRQDSLTGKVSEAIHRYLSESYQGVAVKTEVIRGEISKRPEGCKRTSSYIQWDVSKPFTKKVFRLAVTRFLSDHPEWARSGHSILKAGHKAGFTEERVA